MTPSSLPFFQENFFFPLLRFLGRFHPPLRQAWVRTIWSFLFFKRKGSWIGCDSNRSLSYIIYLKCSSLKTNDFYFLCREDFYPLNSNTVRLRCDNYTYTLTVFVFYLVHLKESHKIWFPVGKNAIYWNYLKRNIASSSFEQWINNSDSWAGMFVSLSLNINSRLLTSFCDKSLLLIYWCATCNAFDLRLNGL